MSDFKYNLPEENIAKYPPKKRGTSNLLVLNRENGGIEHKKYFNIPEYIRKGDVIVLNETKVRKQRTYFLTPKGKRVEVLFLNEESKDEKYNLNIWYCLIGRAKNVEIGDILKNEENGYYQIKVEKRSGNGFLVSVVQGDMNEMFLECGHTPLPPYMKRDDEEKDNERYNTVFSNLEGSAASPTASLNLTDEILKEIENKGAKIVKVELRVGWGTFAPIREENIEDHEIHEEYISVSKEAVEIIKNAKKQGNDIWAFGTTVARTLESLPPRGGEYCGITNLFVYPGYKWKIVDHLITNFHMPDSSLILLVSAFGGTDNIKKAYQEALDNDYKFLSYGDSMLIL